MTTCAPSPQAALPVDWSFWHSNKPPAAGAVVPPGSRPLANHSHFPSSSGPTNPRRCGRVSPLPPASPWPKPSNPSAPPPASNGPTTSGSAAAKWPASSSRPARISQSSASASTSTPPYFPPRLRKSPPRCASKPGAEIPRPEVLRGHHPPLRPPRQPDRRGFR